MESVVLVIHLFLALAIIGLVLIQRSEGGGLGIGGGGGLGGLATPQGAANLLTRMTGICAGLFFLTSLILGVMAGHEGKTSQGLMEALDAAPAPVTAPVSVPVVPVEGAAEPSKPDSAPVKALEKSVEKSVDKKEVSSPKAPSQKIPLSVPVAK